MHQAAIRSLGLIEDKLRGNLLEKKVTHHKERQKEEFKRKSSQNETSESSGDEKCQKQKENARNIIAQARVNNSRYAWREENYEDDKKRWARYALPAGFAKCRYPKDSSFCTINKNMMVSRTHSMVIRLPASSTNTRRNKSNGHAKFAVTPTGAARSWLNTLPNDSIGSWEN
jgi:hypothetical protein